jgi:hypothetical protein
VRSVVGHFGAYREGVGPLVSGLRRTFDPGQCLVVALGDTEGMEGTGGAAGTGGDDVPGN